MKKKTVSKTIWGVQCVVCDKRMFSFHVHDYKLCGCKNDTMVDGGREYLRYGWKVLRPKRIKWCKRDGKYPSLDTKIKDKFPY